MKLMKECSWVVIAVAALMMSGRAMADYSDVVLADNPILYYQFEDAGSALNSGNAGSAYNATYVGGITLGTGAVGSAALFNGSTTYVSVPDTHNVLGGPGDFTDPPFRHMTFEAWVNTSAVDFDGLGRILQCSTPFTDVTYDGAGTPGTWRPSTYMYENNGTYAEGNFSVTPVSSAAEASLGDWHHLVLTGTYYVNNLWTKVYIDGFHLQTSHSTHGDMSFISNGGPLYFGGDTVNQFMHNGALDEIAFYGTALDLEQIQAHYVAGRGSVSGFYTTDHIELNPLGAGDYDHYGFNLTYGGANTTVEDVGDGDIRGIPIRDVNLSGGDLPEDAFELDGVSMMIDGNDFTVDNRARTQGAVFDGEDATAATQLAHAECYVGGVHEWMEMSFSGLKANADVFVQLVGGDIHAGDPSSGQVTVTGAAPEIWEAADGDTRTASLFSITGAADSNGEFVARIDENDGWIGVAGIILSQLAGSPPVPGDATNDGRVDQADAQILAAYWGAPVEAGNPAYGDFNGDGIVNVLDAAILAANWSPAQGPAETTATPEPSVLMLMAMGLLTCFCRRR